MAKTLRLRLQFWHAAILLLVILSFGAAFYLQLVRSVVGEIDADLLGNARVLEGALRSVPLRPDGPPPGPFFERLGPGHPAMERRGPERSQDPPPPDGLDFRGPPRMRLNGDQRLQRVLELTPSRPLGPDDAPLYFAVFADDGEILRQVPAERQFLFETPSRPVEYRRRGEDREILLRGPHGTIILVGRDVHAHLDRLSRWLFQLIVSGASVLFVGLLGGWWLSGKAVSPIRQISQTAASVSANTLSQRIDNRGMDRELLDLTSVLNSMLERIEASFTQQTQFTANASHELRTPLAVLLSHCELALSRTRTAEEYQETIATCQRASRRMQALVEDLLVLARADSGKLDLQVHDCDLHTIAAEAFELLTPLAEARSIDLKLNGGSVPLSADAPRISQVVVNLLNNAIQYNRAGGRVAVCVSEDSGCAVLTVKDSGCGISQSDIPQLFDRFYRVDQARSRQSGGSGLGLAICKSIVELHHGSIEVDSQIETGSTFTVRLPKGG